MPVGVIVGLAFEARLARPLGWPVAIGGGTSEGAAAAAQRLVDAGATALLSFGIAALLLAMLGIYGVLSYSTEMRKQEIGMRMAFGATRRKIYALTLGEAGLPVLGGLVSGLLVSILASSLLRSQLYEIQGVSASMMFSLAALFLAAAAIAAFVPARRAASFDPTSVLRHE